MGTKNLVMLKTHIDSVNLCFSNGFVYENVLWAMASLWVFFCNYVFYSMGLILRYIFRFQVEDRKKYHLVPLSLADQTKRNELEDFEIDGFTENLANLLFPSCEDFHVASEEREGETERCALLEIGSDIHVESKKRGGEKDCFVLKEKDSDMKENDEKKEVETEGSVLETLSDVHEDVKKINEIETEYSVFREGDSNFHQDGMEKVEKEVQEEEKTEEPVIIDNGSATTTSKRQFLLSKDISVLVDEATTMTFTFHKGEKVSDIAFSSTGNVVKKEFSEHNLEEGLVAQEEEESVQEQRTFVSNSSSDRFQFESNAFEASEASDDDYIPYNDDNLLPSDSDSESSSSSGLIWGNSSNNNNNIDDSVQILSSNTSCEGFESESLNTIEDKRVEDMEETQFLYDRQVSHGLAGGKTKGKDEKESYHEAEENRDILEKNEEPMWEDELDELDFDDEDDEDDFEWENDEVVEQLRLEVRNARQGGLATILEEEEDEETESPKVVDDLKPLKIEEKIEYKDHIVEIQKVYRRYAEKIRKLDVLNYQTMHAIGLLQLKDPLKLMLMPKSTVQYAKPLVSQNLWPRKAPKHISDPMPKLVHELHRDLELVYVGQVCLSWEILCWQHKKVQDLKQYDSQWPHRYNLVAGEFQLFQVLMQRFIEDEPFQQGTRIHNYVKNRCVIRNLLQVPAIKDDNTKNKKIIKWGEEDAIASEMLAHIIKESMQVFWEFVRADKDYGSGIHKVSHQNGTDVKDTEISDLLRDIRTQLQKKERKLKDIVRSGNCIVRKFQKHHEDQIQLDHEQLLAQVGLRLISRVVHLKKLKKDQLIWCNEKLNRIKFVGRKVQVEPSFLLFPC